MEAIWLSDAVKYENEIRSKSIRELCNKKDVEQLRYTLRVALEKLQAAQQSVQSDGAYCMCNQNEAPYKIGSNVCAVCEKPRR